MEPWPTLVHTPFESVPQPLHLHRLPRRRQTHHEEPARAEPRQVSPQGSGGQQVNKGLARWSSLCLGKFSRSPPSDLLVGPLYFCASLMAYLLDGGYAGLVWHRAVWEPGANSVPSLALMARGVRGLREYIFLSPMRNCTEENECLLSRFWGMYYAASGGE